MVAETQTGASVTCDVCGEDFEPASEDQRRCSDGCREFARQHRHASAKHLAGLWKQHQCWVEPCPSGKVRHQKKRDAVKAARAAARQRYLGMRDWLRVYQCDRCEGWHLTSKPEAR